MPDPDTLRDAADDARDAGEAQGDALDSAADAAEKVDDALDSDKGKGGPFG